MGWYRNRKPLSERTHTHRVFRALTWDPDLEISIWVDFFWPKFLPFLGEQGGGTGTEDRFGKYFTQPEKSCPTRGVFFDRLLHSVRERVSVLSESGLRSRYHPIGAP
jgi:hypothetical protein